MPIEVKNVSYCYGAQRVLDGVSFTANRGELIAVLGPNGAGKTTLFRCLLGLLRGYEGTVHVCNRDTRTVRRSELARLVAYIPQWTEPVFNYTVLDMVLMGTTDSLQLTQSPGKTQLETAYRALEGLGAADLAKRGFGQISGGERQLALIARAMAQNAKILIMDEPTANLDYGNQYRVLQKIRNLSDSSFTVLLSTHNPEHAFQFATGVLALQDGKVCAYGQTRDVLTKDLIAALYGIEVSVQEIDLPHGIRRSCIPTGGFQ